MNNLTYNQLIEFLKHKAGVVIVGLRCLTDANARKNPFGTIYKQLSTVGFVGVDYEASVNREALRQNESATFEAESLPWGKWLIPNKVIIHTNKEDITKLYIRTQTTPNMRRTIPAKVVCYRNASGHILNRETVKQYLPVARESNKQREETGINQTVWVRTYCFDSIQKIRIAGETFKLVNDVELPVDLSKVKAIVERAKRTINTVNN